MEMLIAAGSGGCKWLKLSLWHQGYLMYRAIEADLEV